MSKRTPWMITGLCLAAVAGAVYLHCSYFFNPLTFKQDQVTHLPWRWYRNPLQLEYAVQDEDGWKMITTTDQAEISLVFRELQNGSKQRLASQPPTDKRIWLGVRRQTDGAMLLTVTGAEKTGVLQLADETNILLTARLEQLLAERLQQARSSSGRRQPPT